MTNYDRILLDKARQALTSSGLPERAWSVGEFKDDRMCLFRIDRYWVAGYFERGRFDARVLEGNPDSGISRFIEQVREMVGPSDSGPRQRTPDSVVWIASGPDPTS